MSSSFITHNLATAYYLGGEILVMCRGRLIERGNMDAVIARPAHPYTQLLVESVPAKSPRERWTTMRGTEAIEASKLRIGEDACVFISRCPYVMDICRQRRPALLPVKDGQKQEAACFLYGER